MNQVKLTKKLLENSELLIVSSNLYSMFPFIKSKTRVAIRKINLLEVKQGFVYIFERQWFGKIY